MIRWCTVPEKWCATDGWTDRQKKQQIEVGALPKKQKGGVVTLKETIRRG